MEKRCASITSVLPAPIRKYSRPWALPPRRWMRRLCAPLKSAESKTVFVMEPEGSFFLEAAFYMCRRLKWSAAYAGRRDLNCFGGELWIERYPYFLINKGFRLAAELTKTVPGRYNLSFNVIQAMCVGAFFAAALHTRLLLCNVPPFIIDHIKGDRQWTSLKNAMRRA